MINDTNNKQVQMEVRDINYMLGAYINNYLFISKNEDPVEVIFPMFQTVPHPRKPGVMIPIRWIKHTDPVAVEIAEDGSNVPEVTPAQEAALDEKDKLIEEVKEQVVKEEPKELKKNVTEKPENKDKPKAQPERVPKQPPSGDLGAGHPDGLGSRNIRLDRKIAQDLKPDVLVDETKEKPTEVEKPKE